MVVLWCYLSYICNQIPMIMPQTAFTVRMDSDIKQQFDELCKDFGMSSNTAFNIFARTVIKQQRIPFDVESEREISIRRGWEAAERMQKESDRNGNCNMSIEEINEEIRLAREEHRVRETQK